MLAACEPRASSGRIHIRDVLPGVVETISQSSEQHTAVTGLSTGLIELDNITTGLQPGDLIVIAARPGMGKSALGANIALHAALAPEQRHVTFFSLEMSKEQLVRRMACGEAHVSLGKASRGKLSPIELQHLDEKAQ